MAIPHFWALVLCFGCLSARTAEPKPRLTQPGKLLTSENFSAASLPANWKPGGRPNSFAVADGALRGVCAPDDSHGPAISVPVAGRNLSIAFDLKFEQPGAFLCLLDGASQFGGQAHLLRVGLGRGGVTVQQDRGHPKSKVQQKAERDRAAKEGRKLSPPTKEQLANPEFYRTERLAGKPARLDDGQWHHLLIEVNGNDVLVQMDGQVTVLAAATMLEVEKSSLVLLVGQAGTVLIDNVGVWENSLLPDAPALKARLAGETAAKP